MSNIIQPPAPEYRTPLYPNDAPFPGSNQQPRKSRLCLWILLGIVSLICILGGTLFALGVSFVANNYGQTHATDMYYTAIKTQDYARAYSYLGSNVKAGLSQEAFTQDAQQRDATDRKVMGEPPILLTLQLASALTPEYGLLGKATYVPSFIDVFTVVYPQLKDLDFTTQANKLQVPVYFLEGRNDVSAIAPLAERYYNTLQAPHKELIWFGSGHSTINDANLHQFMDVMVNHVLKDNK